MALMTAVLPFEALKAAFGDRLQQRVPLAPFTSARAGGMADALVRADSAGELADFAQRLWGLGVRFIVLGGGSNVLVSDAGVREVVMLNRARKVRFITQGERPQVWSESGANFGALARQAAAHGLGGLAWAAGVPGTVGGAVVGNAGAHGADMAGNLALAEILHRTRGHELWEPERLAFDYRSSELKRRPGEHLVLAATLNLEPSSREAIKARMDEYLQYRRRTQPPGASMGSMFKNPPGDYAGRLIEAAGLKGKRIGEAQISPLHGNFFLNLGGAKAADIWALLRLAREEVAGKFGVTLELEIERLGEWALDDQG
jgi:UDP-N-acetylmuramate dehydrogenase